MNLKKKISKAAFALLSLIIVSTSFGIYASAEDGQKCQSFLASPKGVKLGTEPLNILGDKIPDMRYTGSTGLDNMPKMPENCKEKSFTMSGDFYAGIASATENLPVPKGDFKKITDILLILGIVSILIYCILKVFRKDVKAVIVEVVVAVCLIGVIGWSQIGVDKVASQIKANLTKATSSDNYCSGAEDMTKCVYDMLYLDSATRTTLGKKLIDFDNKVITDPKLKGNTILSIWNKQVTNNKDFDEEVKSLNDMEVLEQMYSGLSPSFLDKVGMLCMAFADFVIGLGWWIIFSMGVFISPIVACFILFIPTRRKTLQKIAALGSFIILLMILPVAKLILSAFPPIITGLAMLALLAAVLVKNVVKHHKKAEYMDEQPDSKSTTSKTGVPSDYEEQKKRIKENEKGIVNLSLKMDLVINAISKMSNQSGGKGLADKELKLLTQDRSLLDKASLASEKKAQEILPDAQTPRKKEQEDYIVPPKEEAKNNEDPVRNKREADQIVPPSSSSKETYEQNAPRKEEADKVLPPTQSRSESVQEIAEDMKRITKELQEQLAKENKEQPERKKTSSEVIKPGGGN